MFLTLRYNSTADRNQSETPSSTRALLAQRNSILDTLDRHPHSLLTYIDLAHCYTRLQYPDLAVGAAYYALLLSDAIADESDEFHDHAVSTLRALRLEQTPRECDEELSGGLQVWVKETQLPEV